MRTKFIYIYTTLVVVILTILSSAYVMAEINKEVYKEAYKETAQKTNLIEITESDTIRPAISLLYDATFLIDTNYNSRSLATGTGFAYKKDNEFAYIITNYHVIDGGNEIYLVSADGTEVKAEVLGSDSYADIAVLRVPAADIKQVAIIGSSEQTNLGDTLFTVGSPLGIEYIGTVTKGILSGKDRLVEVDTDDRTALMDVLQTDAAINPGNSGGPLANINGEVIGINSLKLVQDEVEGMGFAIPIEDAIRIATKLELGDGFQRPLFGIELTDASNTYALFTYNIVLDDDFDSGIVVISLVEGFPAEDAGIQKGDVILKVDGEEVKNSDHFRYLLYKYDINDEIEITYFREGETRTLNATLNKTKDD